MNIFYNKNDIFYYNFINDKVKHITNILNNRNYGIFFLMEKGGEIMHSYISNSLHSSL